MFSLRFPTNIEQAKKWLEAIRFYNEIQISGANGMVCCKHFQSHEFQMVKGRIYKLLPGVVPSVFFAFGENDQIPEIPLSPELSEIPKLTTLIPLIPEIAPSVHSSKNQSGDDDSNAIAAIDDEECDQSVQENTINTSNLLQNARNRFINISHRRWTDKARYLKRRVHRLKATAKQISQTISEMKKQQKKDAELLKTLEVFRISSIENIFD